MDREATICEYVSYVEKIVNLFIYRKNIPYSLRDDLISTGYLALVNAVDSFDPNRKASLKTYITYKVKKRILSELRGSIDLLGRITRRNIKKLIDIEDNFVSERERIPTKNELEKEFYSKVYDNNNKTDIAFKNAWLLKDFNTCDLSVLENTYYSNYDVEDKVIRKDIFNKAKLIVPELPYKYSYAMNRYFFDDVSMAVIGDELGVTESRISQIISEGILRLRKLFNNKPRRKLIMNEPVSLNSISKTQVCKECRHEFPLTKEYFSTNWKSKTGFLKTCISCVARNKQLGQQRRYNNKQFNKQIVNPVNKKAVKSTVLTIDFTGYESTFENLKIIAKEEIRTIEQQALYILINESERLKDL